MSNDRLDALKRVLEAIGDKLEVPDSDDRESTIKNLLKKLRDIPGIAVIERGEDSTLAMRDSIKKIEITAKLNVVFHALKSIINEHENEIKKYNMGISFQVIHKEGDNKNYEQPIMEIAAADNEGILEFIKSDIEAIKTSIKPEYYSVFCIELWTIIRDILKADGQEDAPAKTCEPEDKSFFH